MVMVISGIVLTLIPYLFFSIPTHFNSLGLRYFLLKPVFIDIKVIPYY